MTSAHTTELTTWLTACEEGEQRSGRSRYSIDLLHFDAGVLAGTGITQRRT